MQLLMQLKSRQESSTTRPDALTHSGGNPRDNFRAVIAALLEVPLLHAQLSAD